jgi:hypothetical protein
VTLRSGVKKCFHRAVLPRCVAFRIARIEHHDRQAGMAQRLLHVLQITASVKRVVRVGVPQPMCAGPFQIVGSPRIAGSQEGSGPRKNSLVQPVESASGVRAALGAGRVRAARTSDADPGVDRVRLRNDASVSTSLASQP